MTDRAGGLGAPTLMAPVTIELGVVGDDDWDPFAAAARLPQRPNPWLALLFVLGCAVLGLAAAGEPLPRPQLLFGVEDALEPPRLAGNLVLTQVDSAQGPVLTAIGVADGVVRWRYHQDARMQAVPAGSVVLVSPFFCRGLQSFVTQALDAATGAARWQVPGAPVWPVADSELVVVKQPSTGCSEATAGFDPLPSAPFVWAGVDRATGRLAWSLAVPEQAQVAAGTDAAGRARWIAVASNGTLRTYDLRTGAELGRLPIPPDPISPLIMRVLGAAGDVLISERGGNGLSIRAYTPTFTPRWTARLTSPGTLRLDQDTFLARPCGPVVCIGSAAQTVGLDADTGVERWRVPGRPWRLGDRYGLFVNASADSQQQVLTVYDLADGTVRADLSNAELIGRLDTALLVRAPIGPGGGIYRLDLTTGTPQLVTRLPGPYTDCDTGGRFLACRVGGGRLDLWRLPADCPPRCGSIDPHDLPARPRPGTS